MNKTVLKEKKRMLKSLLFLLYCEFAAKEKNAHLLSDFKLKTLK